MKMHVMKCVSIGLSWNALMFSILRFLKDSPSNYRRTSPDTTGHFS